MQGDIGIRGGFPNLGLLDLMRIQGRTTENDLDKNIDIDNGHWDDIGA